MRFLGNDYDNNLIFMGSMWALFDFVEKED
jgi:hypothetical protein